MIILVVILTFACPSGNEETDETTFAYPKAYEGAISFLSRSQTDLRDGTGVMNINGVDCELVEVVAGHRKIKTK